MTYYNWPVRRGEEHPFASLTESQVKEIKLALRKGVSDVELAKQYKVQKPCISQIRRGTRWRHVTIDPPNLSQENQ